MANLNRISKDTDISKEVQRLQSLGWKFLSGKKHGKLVSPGGYKIMIPCTPGGPTAFQQLKSSIRRAIESDANKLEIEANEL